MYHDLGPNHFHRRSKERQKNHLVKRLADLGYAVELAPHFFPPPPVRASPCIVSLPKLTDLPDDEGLSP
jgi:hypothetical protein